MGVSTVRSWLLTVREKWYWPFWSWVTTTPENQSRKRLDLNTELPNCSGVVCELL